ncbi:MAG: ArsR family transcriptional regulator [Methanomicrobiaceae archaeon]|uniref:HTH marR-type domain-containing protein n=1 Tax=hydrocarbon metagenome TaxID=938273 RepID=A0A0W8FJ06_9ZZZZ|nr:ArsR family transcriptional regulator [Methanomicrobiaceae archaeon]MDD5419845.1 helix-turn-helix domain-containing protein [Methanomicrobiaceae archaeon]
MKSEKVRYFTPKEEELAELLMGIGIKRNVSKVLVYLASTDEATSRDIERGTDLRQPEVSIAMRHLKECKWVETRESKSESKGRPVKIYTLSRPITDIMDTIENEKKKEARHQLELIKKMRECISLQ